MSNLEIIELTERQAEIADWLMGLPWIEHWNDPERDGAEAVCDYEKEFDQPKLEDQRMAVPPSEDFVEHIRQELDRYQQMALDAGQLDNAQQDMGLRRVCRNLTEKMREVSK